MTPILPTSRFHTLLVTSCFFWLPLTMYTCGRGYIFVRRLQLTIHAKTLMVGYICKLHIFASSPKTAIVPQELILNKTLYVQPIFREKRHQIHNPAYFSSGKWFLSSQCYLQMRYNLRNMGRERRMSTGTIWVPMFPPWLDNFVVHMK